MGDGEAVRNIRGVGMCLPCYIIALEHCADFTFSMIKDMPLPEEAARILRENTERLKAEKELDQEVRRSLIASKSCL